MKKQPETFESLIRSFEHRYDLRTVFDDFLTMTLCSFSPNPKTGKSYDEELYMQTIAPYKDDPLRYNFPKMLDALTSEMTALIDSSDGNDVLGEFYQRNLYRKGASQYFTPWPVCQLMAGITFTPDGQTGQTIHPLRILDPACGSGRMLVAGAKILGNGQQYYGIDLDHTCVKMTALNLFLNGCFGGEVMWADALRPDDFRMSYKLSVLPFGIFRITEKEKSRLWYLHVSGFSETKSGSSESSGLSQLNLF